MNLMLYHTIRIAKTSHFQLLGFSIMSTGFWCQIFLKIHFSRWIIILILGLLSHYGNLLLFLLSVINLLYCKSICPHILLTPSWVFNCSHYRDFIFRHDLLYSYRCWGSNHIETIQFINFKVANAVNNSYIELHSEYSDGLNTCINEADDIIKKIKGYSYTHISNMATKFTGKNR